MTWQWMFYHKLHWHVNQYSTLVCKTTWKYQILILSNFPIKVFYCINGHYSNLRQFQNQSRYVHAKSMRWFFHVKYIKQDAFFAHRYINVLSNMKVKKLYENSIKKRNLDNHGHLYILSSILSVRMQVRTL